MGLLSYGDGPDGGFNSGAPESADSTQSMLAGMTPEQRKKFMLMMQMQGKAGGTGAAGVINGMLGGLSNGMQMGQMMQGGGPNAGTGLMGLFSGGQSGGGA